MMGGKIESQAQRGRKQNGIAVPRRGLVLARVALDFHPGPELRVARDSDAILGLSFFKATIDAVWPIRDFGPSFLF